MMFIKFSCDMMFHWVNQLDNTNDQRLFVNSYQLEHCYLPLYFFWIYKINLLLFKVNL